MTDKPQGCPIVEPQSSTAILLDIFNQVSDLRESFGSLEATVENLSHNASKQVAQACTERRDMQITITDIRGEIGKIEGALAVGNERHRDAAKSLDRIEGRANSIDIEIVKISPLAVSVSEMKPQVKELMEFKGRLAAIMLTASTIIGTATWFAWEGIKWFFPDAKAAILRLFH
jgi:hypothetical protein